MLPLWLSPVQAAILPVSDKVNDYAQKVSEKFKEAGIRTEIDYSNQTLGAKIRSYTLQKVPFLCIIGEKEVEKSSDNNLFVSVRGREGKDLGTLALHEFLDNLKNAIEKRN